MTTKLTKLLGRPLYIIVLLFVIVTIITAQNYFSTSNIPNAGTSFYTHYNNYLIFKNSFSHLNGDSDLYQSYPKQYWDYYKYSPTFAVLMAPFTKMPDIFGLFIWNLLNVFVLFYAIWLLPEQPAKTRSFMLFFVLIEMITALQNSQSNSLVAGLVILAFICMERNKTGLAALFIVLTIFIKLFGMVALLLFILYPNKLKATFYTLLWVILFFCLPLLVISAPQLAFLYYSWINLIENDLDVSTGLSVTGWLYSWFGLEYKKTILAAGTILLCLPLLKFSFFSDLRFKLLFLSSILIWMVIFNQKAESPSFVIAVCGMAIWFFTQTSKPENIILLILALIFTILSPTDIFPKSLRVKFVIPYVLKALPCILVWLKICWDLISYKAEQDIRPVSETDY